MLWLLQIDYKSKPTGIAIDDTSKSTCITNRNQHVSAKQVRDQKLMEVMKDALVRERAKITERKALSPKRRYDPVP